MKTELAEPYSVLSYTHRREFAEWVGLSDYPRSTGLLSPPRASTTSSERPDVASSFIGVR